MKVCIDVSAAAQGRGGIGRYSEQLARALTALPVLELSLLYHGRARVGLPPALAGLPRRHVRLGSKPWRAGVALAHVLRLPLDRLVGPVDVFHATDHLLPPLRRVATVFTVHDLAFLVHPETHLRGNRLFLAAVVPRFARAATRVIADSEATRQDVLRYCGVPPEHVRVVHLGVDARFRPLDPREARALVAARFGLRSDYLLFVGTLEPRKNLRALLAAHCAIPDAPPLVIAGAPGWRYAEVYREVRARRDGARVRFLGRVAEADLPALYSAATAFCYPSRYEGFGLPPLEALACGTPVVCSDRSALPEVVGDAALLVDPDDPRAITAALGRVLTDEELRRELRGRGLARAAQFTWERAAAATAAVYAEAWEAWRRGQRRT